MSLGFKIFNEIGGNVLSSDDLTFSIIDVFSVSPNSSGSKTYANLAGRNVIIAQSAVEPTSIDFTSLFSLNSMTTSSFNSGSDKVVSWSPGVQYLNAYNVQLFVLGY